ncbi:hypothetical protein N9N03_01585 [Chlamydiia bacterium]|nr:hypothetical protein [Chlamydiia bacterium]
MTAIAFNTGSISSNQTGDRVTGTLCPFLNNDIFNHFTKHNHLKNDIKRLVTLVSIIFNHHTSSSGPGVSEPINDFKTLCNMQDIATSKLDAIRDMARCIWEGGHNLHLDNVARLIYCLGLPIERDDELTNLCTIQRTRDEGVRVITIQHNGQAHTYISEVRAQTQPCDYKQTAVWEKVDGIFLGFRTEINVGEQRVEVGEFYAPESTSSDDDVNLLSYLGRLKFGYRHKSKKTQSDVAHTLDQLGKLHVGLFKNEPLESRLYSGTGIDFNFPSQVPHVKVIQQKKGLFDPKNDDDKKLIIGETVYYLVNAT